MKIPTVLIVGRPNVGKSTLFNRLTGKAAALVFDRPGVTRDIIESRIEIGARTVKLLDSAGWPYPIGEDRKLSDVINRNVERELKTCDVIVWVVDGRAGKTGAEDLFADRLVPFRKKIILAVNKIDELDRPDAAWAQSEFSGLPWNTHFVLTAKHGRGIADLLTEIEEIIESKKSKSDDDGEEETEDPTLLRISILGRPNVGKSTLLNRLLKKERMVVSDVPGTTRDSIESIFQYEGRAVSLIDTAGVRRIDKIHDGLERTMARISLSTGRQADVTLVMMDISQGLAEQDLRLLSHLWRRGSTAIAVANKWDLVPERKSEAAKELQETFRDRAHEAKDVPFVLISAKTGHGISNMMATVFRSNETANRTIRTSEFNRQLQEWNSQMPTGLFRGNIGKMKYGVQTQTQPLAFKIFVNNPDFFRGPTMRYLDKRVRESFDIQGVPILIHLVKSVSTLR